MAQIKAKQIKLENPGDLIVGNSDSNGDILGLGSEHQFPTSNGSTVQWAYNATLRDSSGNLIIEGQESSAPVNYFVATNADSGSAPTVSVAGTDTNINLTIESKGTGRIVLDGDFWPEEIAQAGSILYGTSAGDLAWTTTPDNTGDQIIRYNDTTNTVEWVSLGTVIATVAFTTVSADSGSAIADGPADILNVLGGQAISTVGENINDSITVELDVDSLTLETNLDSTNDYLVIYDASENVHVKTNIDSIYNQMGTRLGQDEEIALGAVNETFSGFFSQVPQNDDSISVYFNGIRLRASGWSRTGQNLTLIDSVNGYQTDAGDIISAHYIF